MPTELFNQNSIKQKGASFVDSLKGWSYGSLTLEAAMVLPIILLIFTGFLSFFSFLEIEVRLQNALNYVSQRIAAYYYVVDHLEAENITEEIQAEVALPVIKTALTPGIVKEMVCEELGDAFSDEKIIVGGKSGLSFIGSGYDSVYQTIRVQVYYRLQIPLFSGISLSKMISQKAVYRAWTGSNFEESSEETYVYVTQNGTVYHTSLSCTYLNISAREVAFSTLEALRNMNGEKYTACSLCCKESTAEIVYVTNYGNKYHLDQNCTAIRRDVKTIPLSEVGELPLCERCLERSGR